MSGVAPSVPTSHDVFLSVLSAPRYGRTKGPWTLRALEGAEAVLRQKLKSSLSHKTQFLGFP